MVYRITAFNSLKIKDQVNVLVSSLPYKVLIFNETRACVFLLSHSLGRNGRTFTHINEALRRTNQA